MEKKKTSDQKKSINFAYIIKLPDCQTFVVLESNKILEITFLF